VVHDEVISVSGGLPRGIMGSGPVGIDWLVAASEIQMGDAMTVMIVSVLTLVRTGQKLAS